MDVDLQQLLTSAAEVGAKHRDTVGSRPVQPSPDRDALASAFGVGAELQAGPTRPEEVVRQLVEAARPGLMGTVGPRFFGFVIGGSSPAATAADILATGWDQCAYNEVLSPAAAAAERAAGGWSKQLLGLPASASVGFVTGAQAANTVGLAVGRHRALADAGWDVERDGLFGAPRVAIVASEERHATIDRAARLLGFGTSAIHPVPATSQGAVDVEALGRTLDTLAGAPVIVCLQAGNVNTGACDDLRRAVPLAHRSGAWVHVDGAFGLWAAASPHTAHLLDGVEAADSWGTDAHKWLNVPYDSGLAFCADAALQPPRCRMPRPTSPGRVRARTSCSVTSPPNPPVGQGDSRSGRRCVSSAETASPTSSTGRAPSHAGWRRGSRPAARPSTTRSCSTSSS
ncbi:MAG TPA: aminotransferase class V-fold PLP-dependent enzyme [Humibacillus xanthopallidus]|nr:aminotransferase class V-fold PLP-dependent enzyme [Humibacillus xanthopallidus]